jgi:hypothetical protein
MLAIKHRTNAKRKPRICSEPPSKQGTSSACLACKQAISIACLWLNDVIWAKTEGADNRLQAAARHGNICTKAKRSRVCGATTVGKPAVLLKEHAPGNIHMYNG